MRLDRTLFLGLLGGSHTGTCRIYRRLALIAVRFLEKMMNGLPGLFAGMAVRCHLCYRRVPCWITNASSKGDYLAIATLGVAEIINVAVTKQKVQMGLLVSVVPLTNTWTITYIALVLTTILILNYTFSSAGRATYAVLQTKKYAARSGGSSDEI